MRNLLIGIACGFALAAVLFGAGVAIYISNTSATPAQHEQTAGTDKPTLEEIWAEAESQKKQQTIEEFLAEAGKQRRQTDEEFLADILAETELQRPVVVSMPQSDVDWALEEQARAARELEYAAQDQARAMEEQARAMEELVEIERQRLMDEQSRERRKRYGIR
jgi:hypothetical protein